MRMGSGRTTVTLLIVVMCGSLTALVALGVGVAAWTWMILAIVPICVAGVTVRLTARRAPSMVEELNLPVAPVERRATTIQRVILPSGVPDYDFVFGATVRWFPTGSGDERSVPNPSGLAVAAVLDRARQVTERRDPRRSSLVQHELDGLLGSMERDASGLVVAMAETVTLSLSEHDQERLDKLAAVRKDEEVWDHERKWEQSKRAYLGDDVLKDSGSAVVWWLVRNEDHIERTVGDLGLLAQLSSAANNEDVPERLRHLVPHPAPMRESLPPEYVSESPFSGEPMFGHFVGTSGPTAEETSEEASAAEHFAAFLGSIDIKDGDPCRQMFAHQVATLLCEYGRPDVADDLFRRFEEPVGTGPLDSGGRNGSTVDAARGPGM